MTHNKIARESVPGSIVLLGRDEEEPKDIVSAVTFVSPNRRGAKIRADVTDNAAWNKATVTKAACNYVAHYAGHIGEADTPQAAELGEYVNGRPSRHR